MEGVLPSRFLCFKTEQRLAMPLLHEVLTQAYSLDCSRGQAGRHTPGQSNQALLLWGH